MIRSKHAFKALAACGLVLGLVALSTGTGQAEKGAHWMVNGETLSPSLLPEVAIFGIESSDMSLSAKVGISKIEILCQKAQFVGAKLESEGTITSGNKTVFKECVTKINEKISPSCVPHSPGDPNGTFASAGLKGSIVLHEPKAGEKTTLILFEPASGTEFGTIVLGTEGESECSAAEKCVIAGVSTVKDSKNEFGVERVTHTVEQGPLSSLTFGGNPATIAGSAQLGLVGTHTGLAWSAIPG